MSDSANKNDSSNGAAGDSRSDAAQRQKELVAKLLARRGSTVYFLLREESADKLPELLAFWGVSKTRAIPVYGNLDAKRLGVAADQIKALDWRARKATHKGKVPETVLAEVRAKLKALIF